VLFGLTSQKRRGLLFWVLVLSQQLSANIDFSGKQEDFEKKARCHYTPV
jgi:hypothetical protein